jgi:small subunit ribosomal protein S20
MPIIKSAKKRVRVATKATIRNRKTKRSLKVAVKAFQANIAGDKKKATSLQSEAQSAIDQAVKKGVIHKNKAARKKAQLSKAAQMAGVKTEGKKAAKPATKAPAKKPVAKKPAAKKPAAKK